MPRQTFVRQTFQDAGARSRSIARIAAGDRALNWRAVRSICSSKSSSERASAGGEGAFPLFSSPRGKEALVVLLRETPLSQEDFAQFRNSKQACEIAAIFCYLSPQLSGVSSRAFLNEDQIALRRLR